jgi:hypothetical protein
LNFTNEIRPWSPFHSLKRATIALPEMNAVVVRANHGAHSFRLSRKARVAEQPAHVKRSVVRISIQPHEAIAGVAQGRTEEVLVLREECDATMPMQQRDDVRVLIPRWAMSCPIWRK